MVIWLASWWNKSRIAFSANQKWVVSHSRAGCVGLVNPRMLGGSHEIVGRFSKYRRRHWFIKHGWGSCKIKINSIFFVKSLHQYLTWNFFHTNGDRGWGPWAIADVGYGFGGKTSLLRIYSLYKPSKMFFWNQYKFSAKIGHRFFRVQLLKFIFSTTIKRHTLENRTIFEENFNGIFLKKPKRHTSTLHLDQTPIPIRLQKLST